MPRRVGESIRRPPCFPSFSRWRSCWSTQAEGGGPAAYGGCAGNPFFLFPLFLAIFYFVYIRPTGQERKQHEDLIGNLKRGDEVVLRSGIIGKIGDISDKTIHLELARNVKLEVLKTAIARRKAELDLSDGSDKSSKSEGAKSSKNEGGKSSKK